MDDLTAVARVLLDVGFPAFAVGFAAYLKVKRVSCACEMHRQQVEALLELLDRTSCSFEACSGKTPAQCAHHGKLTNETRRSLPIARVFRR